MEPKDKDRRAVEKQVFDEDGFGIWRWCVEEYLSRHNYWATVESFMSHADLVEKYPELDVCDCGRPNASGWLSCMECMDAERTERERELSTPIIINGQKIYPDPQCGWDGFDSF